MKKKAKLNEKKNRVNEDDEDLDLDLGTDTDPATQEPESPGEPEDGDEESIETLDEDEASTGTDPEQEIPGIDGNPEDAEEAATGGLDEAAEGEDDDEESDDEDDDEESDDEDDDEESDSDDDKEESDSDDDEDDDDEDEEDGKPWESTKKRLSEAFKPTDKQKLYTYLPESHQHKPVSVVAESREMAERIVKAVLVKEGVLKDQKQALPEGDMVRSMGVFEAVATVRTPKKKAVNESKTKVKGEKKLNESRDNELRNSQGFRKLSRIIGGVR